MSDGELWDDPNRQAVGLEPIWTGAGDPGATPKATATAEDDEADELGELTKAQLIERAAEVGADVHETWNKAEIKAAIAEAEANG